MRLFFKNHVILVSIWVLTKYRTSFTLLLTDYALERQKVSI
jgi:hypothetical protein